MKRILSIIIVLLICVSAFSGCDNVLPQNGGSQTTDDTLNTNVECEHNWERIGNLNESTARDRCTICGETRLYTDPDSLSGNRLLYAMTIAETLPSCVVFEYKDEKPYCFYAYNSEGKLCRVFWNDFAGLNEKDLIAVECDGDFKALSYDEYPDGGWTPQYEVTAIRIYSEAEWNAMEGNTYQALSDFLDHENFVAGLSQGELIDQLGKYKYNGEKVTDIAIGANYDSEYGGGLTASGDFFGYENYFYQKDRESKSANSFYTEVALEGLTLPYGIVFEDSLSDVFQKLGISMNPYSDFVADADSTTNMTLYSNNKATLVFKDLKRTDAPVEYERPYELVYSETTSSVLPDGRTKTIQRTVKLAFNDHDENASDTLGGFEMSVVVKSS